jgi:hypothetical protein
VLKVVTLDLYPVGPIFDFVSGLQVPVNGAFALDTFVVPSELRTVFTKLSLLPPELKRFNIWPFGDLTFIIISPI